MRYTVGELVYENSKGRADKLNKITSSNEEIRMSVIGRIWNILVLLPDDEYLTVAEMPEQLVFKHQRFHFGDQEQVTYSKSALKKHLLQILRRIFEASSFSELLGQIWFSHPHKNILSVIRANCSDLSVVLYMLNGIDFKESDSGRFIKCPRHITDLINSVCIDFAARYGTDSATEDLALANISSTFIYKYYTFVSDSGVKFVMLDYLLVNTKQHPESLWPFARTLWKLVIKKLDLYPKTDRILPALTTRLWSVAPEELESRGTAKDLLGLILWAIKMVKKARSSELQLDSSIISKISLHNCDSDTKLALMTVIFHTNASFDAMDHAACQWLEEATEMKWRRPENATECCIFLMQLNGNDGACPVEFVCKFIEKLFDFIDWKRVVSSTVFFAFVEQNAFTEPCSLELIAFLTGLFEHSILLKCSVHAGLLQKIHIVPYSTAPQESVPILVNCMVFEEDDDIVSSQLSFIHHHFTDHLLTLPLAKALNVIKRTARLLIYSEAREYIFRLSRDLPRYQCLVENLNPEIGSHLLSEGVYGFVRHRDADYSKVSWLQPSDNDTEEISFLKQAIIDPQKLSMYDIVDRALRFHSSRFPRSIFVYCDLGKRLPEYPETDFEETIFSPVLDYCRSLENSVSLEFKSSQSLNIADRDYLLYSRVYNGDNFGDTFSMDKLFSIPVGLLAHNQSLLAWLLKRFFTSQSIIAPQQEQLPDWFITSLSQLSAHLLNQG